MRNIYFLICVLLSAGTIGYIAPYMDIDFSDNVSEVNSYAVEIASFKYPVYTDYFENLDDVVEINDQNGVYHYIAGITTSKLDAESLSSKIKDLGYGNAKMIDLNESFDAKLLQGLLPQDKTQTKKKEAEVAIAKLAGIGNEYFYSIRLMEDEQMLTKSQFDLQGVKALKQDGKFHYLYGRFEDVSSAHQYMSDKILKKYPKATLVVLNKGNLVLSSERAAKPAKLAEGSYNMGRKMRGKEYVDYYYELAQFKFSKTPVYFIELGPYDDKAKAAEAVLKLKDLGFSQAKLADPSKKKEEQIKRSPSADAHFTIQVFASKTKLNDSRFKMEVSSSYDQNDNLYRYFHGDFDNYWVCRRELREVRNQGYKDAFIVKL